MKTMGRKSIVFTNNIINYIVLTIIVMLAAFAGYALWDSKQLHQVADKSKYAAYKPTAGNEGKSFQELRSINSEVFAWLTVYGTNIDYPVTQGNDNMKYVNTNAEGQYSLSGSIFLDCNNNKDFSDFNEILYGHHMAKKVMFGEISEFANKNTFDSHRYGNLYFDGTDHGIEFFAFIHTDAYDFSVFTPNVKEDARRKYLDNLLDKAMYIRDIEVSIDDHIIMLSTCSSTSTNGRDILVGKITGETYPDPALLKSGIIHEEKEKTDTDSRDYLVKEFPVWGLVLLSILTAMLVMRTLDIYFKRKQKKQKEGRNI